MVNGKLLLQREAKIQSLKENKNTIPLHIAVQRQTHFVLRWIHIVKRVQILALGKWWFLSNFIQIILGGEQVEASQGVLYRKGGSHTSGKGFQWSINIVNPIRGIKSECGREILLETGFCQTHKATRTLMSGCSISKNDFGCKLWKPNLIRLQGICWITKLKILRGR